MATSKITIEQYIGFEKKRETKAEKKIPIVKIISFIILSAFCIIWVMPFLIMFFGSLRGYLDNQIYPEKIFYPHSGYTLENYEILLLGKYPEGLSPHNSTEDYRIGLWFLNSCFSAIGGTLLYLFVASLAAYAFTFLPFKYRDVLFTGLVMSMVIPGAATSVGNQMIVFGSGLNELYLLALIVPGLGGVYGMYLIRTFFSSIPKDLIESAKMDGYSNFKIFVKIVLPLGKTVLFVQGLFGFMGGWNDLIWPQMLFGSTNYSSFWTLQVGMAYIIHNSKTVDLIGTALAGGVICLAPVLVMYLVAQKYIVEGMASAGIKG